MLLKYLFNPDWSQCIQFEASSLTLNTTLKHFKILFHFQNSQIVEKWVISYQQKNAGKPFERLLNECRNYKSFKHKYSDRTADFLYPKPI